MIWTFYFKWGFFLSGSWRNFDGSKALQFQLLECLDSGTMERGSFRIVIQATVEKDSSAFY